MIYRGMKIILIVVIFIVSLFADFLDYRKNISQLKGKIEQKNQLKSEINQLNIEINSIEEIGEISWLRKRKLAKLSQQKALKSDAILPLYKEISELKSVCSNEFNILMTQNGATIDSIAGNLGQQEDRKPLIQLLLEEKQKRDFLVETQKYFTNVNEKDLEFSKDYKFFNFTDEKIRNDFKSILEVRIQNISKAQKAAEKEINMRNKLREFRDEIAFFQEPLFENEETSESRGEEDSKRDEYDNSWETDSDEENMNNSYDSPDDNDFDYNFESIRNEDDFLFLFEGQNDESVESFINQMDSLKIYYEEILKKISN